MFNKVVFLAIGLVFTFSAASCKTNKVKKSRGHEEMSSLINLPSYPSEVRFVEVPEGEWGTLPTLHMSDKEKFVFFKNGTETEDLRDADEIVAIISIEILFIDKENKPCSKANAIQTIVSELGSEGRLLRKTKKLIEK